MKRFFFILAILCSLLPGLQPFATAQQVSFPFLSLPNESTTGTTPDHLVKVTGSPSAAIITAITDTKGAIGISTNGGTQGTANIQLYGSAQCTFDGPTTAGHFITISSTFAGDCTDAGAVCPGTENIGMIFQTNGTAGVYPVLLGIGTCLGTGGVISGSGAAGAATFWTGFSTLGSDLTNLAWDDTLMRFSINGSGTATGGLNVGNVGTEAAAIIVDGVSYTAEGKFSDIGNTDPSVLLLHKHSTTIQSVLGFARSNSNTAAHSDLTNGQIIGSVISVGTAGADYKQFASIDMGADASGTISNTSAPGFIAFNVTPDTTLTPAEAIKINNAGLVKVDSLGSGKAVASTANQQLTSVNIRYTSQFAGADWAAKVNAAEADLGATPGEIWLDSGAGIGSAATTALTISHNAHILRVVTPGTYFTNKLMTFSGDDDAVICSNSSESGTPQTAFEETSGANLAAFLITSGYNFTFDHCSVFGNKAGNAGALDGIVASGTKFHMFFSQAFTFKRHNVVLAGTTQDTFLTNSKFIDAGSNGLEIQTGAVDVFWTASEAENNGLYQVHGAGSLGGLHFDGGDISSATGGSTDCIFLDGTASLIGSIHIAGIQISPCNGNAIHLINAFTGTVTGNVISGPGQAAANTYDGIRVDNYGSLSITGNTVVDATTTCTGGPCMRYGINNSAESQLSSITGNTIKGALTNCINAQAADVVLGNSYAGCTGTPNEFTQTKVTVPAYGTSTNCADSAGAAACGSAAAGHFVIDAGSTATVVSTTAVTANSEIMLTRDDSLNSLLSITCNTQSGLILGTPRVTARTGGSSFTVSIDVTPTAVPMCIGYKLTN